MLREPGFSLRQRAQASLAAGGVLAYPTESCFGLGCHPASAHGLRRILALKRRPMHKGMIVVGASWAQLAPYVAPLSGASSLRKNVRNIFHVRASYTDEIVRLVQRLTGQAEAQGRAVTAARRATQLSDARYRNGLVSQLELLDARRSELRNRRQELQVRTAQYVATVGLIRALGGGWGDQPAVKMAAASQ